MKTNIKLLKDDDQNTSCESQPEAVGKTADI